jgi:hypothetical protein
MRTRLILGRRPKVQGYYGSWLPFLRELSTAAGTLAFRFLSRNLSPVQSRPWANDSLADLVSGVAVLGNHIETPVEFLKPPFNCCC